MRLSSGSRILQGKVTDMEHPHCMADAKHIRHFLNCCEGNWHRCIYVRCVSCPVSETCKHPDFLYHPDEKGLPCILHVKDSGILFSRIPEPTECCASVTSVQFAELYQLYLKAEGLAECHCIPTALLKLQEQSCYNW